MELSEQVTAQFSNDEGPVGEQDDEDTLPFSGPVSPIKAIRDSLPIGLRELAKQLNCSYGMVYLAERGCYTAIPPVVRSWITTVTNRDGSKVLSDGLTIQMIDELYLLYIRETRDLFGETYKFVLLDKPTVDYLVTAVVRSKGISCGWSESKPLPKKVEVESNIGLEKKHYPVAPPINALIKYTGLSKTAFYKGLCIQPANIYKLQTAQAKTLPAQVVQALIEAHAPVAVVQYLDTLTREWYIKTRQKTNGYA